MLESTGGGILRYAGTVFDRFEEIEERWARALQGPWRPESSGVGRRNQRVLAWNGEVVCDHLDPLHAKAVAYASGDIEWLLHKMRTMRTRLRELELELEGSEVIGKTRAGDITLAEITLPKRTDGD